MFVCCYVDYMHVLYVSLGSSIVTRVLIFGGGGVFMGSVVLSICKCSWVLISRAGSGVINLHRSV